MAERRSHTLLWILIGGGAFFLFVLAVFSLVYLTLHAGSNEAGFSGFGDRIGVVDLDGVILSPQPVVGQLKKFADDSSIKAIILHVNSPGGGVAFPSRPWAPAGRSTLRQPRIRSMPTRAASWARSE
jgi:protease-4